MTRAHILNTWNQPQRRPGSDRSMPNTNTLGASSSQRMAVLKVVLACLTVSMGYYYASSEAMLVKYSTPKIYNAGSRSTAVLDIPKISSAQQQLQQRQHMLPERSGIDRIETVSTNDITAQVLPKQDHDKYQESKTTAIVKELAALYEPAAQETHDTTSSNNQQIHVDTINHAKIIHANTSYVHYTGCCGIGHRLARMSSAYHAAQRLHFALKGTWPSCSKSNVFDHLFEPEHSVSANINAKTYVQSSQVVKIHNEVPGYATVSRTSSSLVNTTTKASTATATLTRQQCDTCHPHKIQSDYGFYSNLLQRFRKRDQVRAFQEQHAFANHTVIGMHVRAGNGEAGDFANKNRDIQNATHFVETVHKRIGDMVDAGNWKDPPLLFLATDTAHMLDLFRQSFAATHIKMIELPQIRPSKGEGILFGERKRKQHTFVGVDDGEGSDSLSAAVATRAIMSHSQEEDRQNGDDDNSSDTDKDAETQRQTCLLGWDQAFMDMMILASSDVVIATRRSSFVQTIPLSIVTGKPKNQRKVAAPYCEVSQDASLQMTCHESYMNWCCCSSCILEEEHERRRQEKKPKRNTEYVKQLRPDLWDMPALELYQKKMKPTRPGAYFS